MFWPRSASLRCLAPFGTAEIFLPRSASPRCFCPVRHRRGCSVASQGGAGPSPLASKLSKLDLRVLLEVGERHGIEVPDTVYQQVAGLSAAERAEARRQICIRLEPRLRNLEAELESASVYVRAHEVGVNRDCADQSRLYPRAGWIEGELVTDVHLCGNAAPVPVKVCAHAHKHACA